MIVIALLIGIGTADPVIARSAQTFPAAQACETQRKREAGGREALRRQLQARYGVPVRVASRCVRMVTGVRA